MKPTEPVPNSGNLHKSYLPWCEKQTCAYQYSAILQFLDPGKLLEFFFFRLREIQQKHLISDLDTSVDWSRSKGNPRSCWDRAIGWRLWRYECILEFIAVSSWTLRHRFCAPLLKQSSCNYMMEGQLISRAIETRVTPIWKSTWHSHYGITIKVFRARSREVRNHFFSFVLFFLWCIGIVQSHGPV